MDEPRFPPLDEWFLPPLLRLPSPCRPVVNRSVKDLEDTRAVYGPVRVPAPEGQGPVVVYQKPL
jgi:hypothetical protein